MRLEKIGNRSDKQITLTVSQILSDNYLLMCVCIYNFMSRHKYYINKELRFLFFAHCCATTLSQRERVSYALQFACHKSDELALTYLSPYSRPTSYLKIQCYIWREFSRRLLLRSRPGVKKIYYRATESYPLNLRPRCVLDLYYLLRSPKCKRMGFAVIQSSTSLGLLT